ncbi:hypothetical protein A3D70_01550 [Candidatus Adlerbacteria bacterium RIFCSPHIGHO2_02_FULL_54_18]|uniref:Uncharacterized protein n=2 Tax=Candidatus Adleribacteriota TaxID=1752736 RepID=A0A1F4Y3Y6_9BACT|nr:MAG: hypothetical protein A2949_02985 [Candidatus Adlerbacteria bacterium RIFCSPLOWO2_01_FULL_54_21b]OGC88669.1 MAG: hypothetical protein A3D70_01550 [Candidatus Adlerbacteria bacterium RIFCSPHIGHO2_02_FULL_54_18]
MEERLQRIEEKVDTLAKVVTATSKAVDDLTAAVAQGFVHMETTMATKAEMNTGFEGVNGKIEGLHRRMDAELEQKRTIEDRVSKIEIEVFPSLAK